MKIRNRSRPPRAPKNACFSIAKTRVLDPDNFPFFFNFFFYLDRVCLLLTYHVTQARLRRVSKKT